MKKILVVLTNTPKYGKDSEKTGLWLAEATEFVEEVSRAGFEVDFASPKGGEVPLDPRSLGKFFVKKGDREIFESDDFRNRALKNSLAAADLDSKNYAAIYYAGGHGTVWDFPENADFQRAAEEIYRGGGYVCSVCHGAVGLLNLRDENGDFLIKGKKITGFTNFEEVLSGKIRKVPFLTESELKKRGADFRKRLPFTSFALQDGRIITGQNPMSGRAVAKILVENLREKSA